MLLVHGVGTRPCEALRNMLYFVCVFIFGMVKLHHYCKIGERERERERETRQTKEEE